MTEHTPTPLQLAVKALDGQRLYAQSRGNKSVSVRLDDASLMIRACNAHDELVAALKAAEGLAWEVGCESEDGVLTLLNDSRGDLYRQISAALAKVKP